MEKIMNLAEFLFADFGDREQYTIMIVNNSVGYVYPTFTYSHEEAAWHAMIEHRKNGFATPAGTTYTVDGPCASVACKCIGVHIFIQVSETEMVEQAAIIR
jgi:hypothetical protein